MRRSDSLPKISECGTERGHALAELKGRDPMERRVEVEKKERYGQLLREQMAADAARRSADRSRENSDGGSLSFAGSRTANFPDGTVGGIHGGDVGTAGGDGATFGGHFGGTYGGVGGAFGGTYSGPFGGTQDADCGLAAGIHADDGPSPSAARGTRGPSHFRESSAGRLTLAPLRPESGRSAAASMPPSAMAEPRDTADQVAQVQDIMRQRIRHVEDRQAEQLSHLQKAVDDGVASMRNVAEDAVRRHVGSSLEGQAAELRSAMDHMAAVRRDCDSQASQAQQLAQELASMRGSVERAAAEEGSRRAHLEADLQGAMAAVKKDQASHANQLAQELASVKGSMERVAIEEGKRRAKLETDLNGAMAAVKRDQAGHASQLAQELASVRGSVERVVAEEGRQRSQLEKDLHAAMEHIAAVRKECSARASQANELAQELASLRSTTERSATEESCRRTQLQAELHGAREDVAALQREGSAQAARMQGFMDELSSLRRGLAQLEADRNSQQAMLADHAGRIDTLARDHDECRRFRAEVQREQLEQNDALAQLRAEQESLKQRLSDVPGLLQRLQDDMPRIAERVAVDAIRRHGPAPAPAPPPAPAPSPLPAPPVARPLVMPDLSQEAFAALRHDGELYELPALKNAVGRSPACDVSITCSQAVSNKHMTIDFDRDGRVQVRDLGSRNGTFLNERRVSEDAGFVLDSGDAIQLGVDGPSYVFEFGPAYFARWPREPERIKNVQHRAGSPRARGSRAGGAAPGRTPSVPRAR